MRDQSRSGNVGRASAVLRICPPTKVRSTMAKRWHLVGRCRRSVLNHEPIVALAIVRGRLLPVVPNADLRVSLGHGSTISIPMFARTAQVGLPSSLRHGGASLRMFVLAWHIRQFPEILVPFGPPLPARWLRTPPIPTTTYQPSLLLASNPSRNGHVFIELYSHGHHGSIPSLRRWR